MDVREWIKPSIGNIIIITLSAILGIVILKTINARWPLPLGMDRIINAV